MIRAKQDTVIKYRLSTPSEKGVIREVNGQYIYYTNFKAYMNQWLMSFREQQGNTEISNYQMQSIREQVWNATMQHILFNNEIKRLNLEATSEEIAFELRNNPPEFLRNEEQFQTDGKFDFAKYHQAIDDPQNKNNWIPVESYIRDTLPFNKLQKSVLDSVNVSQEELREAYTLQNEKVKANIMVFSPEALSLENISFPDQEIEDYYQTHKEDYIEPEKRKITYFMIEKIPSKSDSASTLADAEHVLRRLNDGESFETPAREFSDDPGAAENGGDLGFFSRGVMVKPFSDAAFAAPLGKVVGPVKTRFGIHYLKVLSKRGKNEEQEV
ncbi:peptidylprolyl isomerase, partial [bacterium]|nr:peptidylprolyl isomerase [bacterium]